MSKIKIFDGTRSVGAPRLCDSCTNGVVLRGPATSDELIHCSLVRQPIAIRVTECNSYVNRSEPPLWALKQIAWVLHVDSKRQKIGFLKAQEWQREHEDEDVVPGYFD